MTQFIEVTPQNANSRILINTSFIQSIVTDLNGKTVIYFLNSVNSATASTTIRESYEDVKKKVLQ